MTTRPRLWTPRHVQVTADAAERPHTTQVLRRLDAAGVSDIRILASNRLVGLSEGSEREIYARAKQTLAVVVAPPSAIKPQPIPPSADWRIDLARGCPAHCQYCYLAGSLQGPPVTRVYANLDDVDALLPLHHGRRTRMRVSINSAEVAGRFEGGTAPVPARLAALRRMALAGYRVGLTIAPIMPLGDWRASYGRLLDDVAHAVSGVPDLDLTVEAITHRFTPGSKETLLGWYPTTRLEMDEGQRSQKRTKFGSTKYVYPRATMAELRDWLTAALEERLPTAPLLYWT